MPNIKIDVIGETCPVPLVEVRKAIRKSSHGDVLEVVGTHPASKKEIPMAMEALGQKILDISEEDHVWRIRILVEKR